MWILVFVLFGKWSYEIQAKLMKKLFFDLIDREKERMTEFTLALLPMEMLFLKGQLETATADEEKLDERCRWKSEERVHFTSRTTYKKALCKMVAVYWPILVKSLRKNEFICRIY